LNRNIYIIGSGDFAFDIASVLVKDLPAEKVLMGFIDDRKDVSEKTKAQSIKYGLNYQFLYPENVDFSISKNQFLFGISDPKYKQQFCEKYNLDSTRFYKFFEHTRINEHAALGASIYRHCNLASNISVGYATFIDALTVVGHGVEIGNFCHIAVNVILGGNVVIEDACYLHSGSIIGKGVKIGAGSIVGAGAIVLRDLPKNSKIISPKSINISG
jgi:acetyltransferase-like isoleucine patch superfamily enzyme